MKKRIQAFMLVLVPLLLLSRDCCFVRGFTSSPSKLHLLSSTRVSLPSIIHRQRQNDCQSVRYKYKDRPEHTVTALRVANDLSSSSSKKARSILLSSSMIVLLTGLAVWKRQPILAFLEFVKDQWLLNSLDRLNAAGPLGLIVYALVFMLWEMTAGVTTPVETAAGMAFGPVKGILASALGKTLGAWASFCLARYIFYDKVQKSVENNEFMVLMEESIQETPLRVALLCRFAPLPEVVKNCGMGVLPVARRWFLASLVLHGLPFTCLWTCVGAETAALLRGLPPSRTLKILLSGATWIGFGTPVLIGMWIKSLKDKQSRKRKRKEG